MFDNYIWFPLAQVKNLKLYLLAAGLLAGVLLPRTTLAQSTEHRSIEVVASATITIPPNVANIRVAIVGTGDSAKTASKAFREKRQRFLDSMGPMNFPDTELKLQHPRVASDVSDQMMEMMNGPFGDEAALEVEPKFKCQENVILRTAISEEPKEMLKQISRVIDGCADVDAVIGGRTMESLYSGESAAPLVSFSRSDQGELEQKCWGKAFDKAKQKANTLAQLTGGKVGKVIRINAAPNHENHLYLSYGTNQADAQFKVSTTLTIQFELTD
jgi:uncharacterized protein YggE